MNSENELLEKFYDNQFGKPFDELSKEELDALKNTASFELFVADAVS